MGNLGIIKTAQYMCDRIHLANISKELVTKTLTLGGTTDKTGNINKLKMGWYDGFGTASSASARRRMSGTATRPVFGSIVQNG